MFWGECCREERSAVCCPAGILDAPSVKSVRAKFRDGEQLLSLSGTEAAQEAGVEQRLFGGGNNKPPAASMNNQSNFTIDPSCRDKPPLAVDIILSE